MPHTELAALRQHLGTATRHLDGKEACRRTGRLLLHIGFWADAQLPGSLLTQKLNFNSFLRKISFVPETRYIISIKGGKYQETGIR